MTMMMMKRKSRGQMRMMLNRLMLEMRKQSQVETAQLKWEQKEKTMKKEAVRPYSRH